MGYVWFFGFGFELWTNQLSFPEIFKVACDLSDAELHLRRFPTILWCSNGLPTDFAFIFEGYGYLFPVLRFFYCDMLFQFLRLLLI